MTRLLPNRQRSYCLVLGSVMCFIKTILPSVTNEVITLVKDTSLAFTLAYSELFSLAKQIAEQAQKGDVIALIGDLGVGKTAFTKGIAAGLGITEPVVSPTYTIVQIYESGRMPLYHFDVYRIGDISEMDETGYEDCFYGEGVTVMEWADLVEPIIPKDAIIVTITKDMKKGADYRKITVEGGKEQIREGNI